MGIHIEASWRQNGVMSLFLLTRNMRTQNLVVLFFFLKRKKGGRKIDTAGIKKENLSFGFS